MATTTRHLCAWCKKKGMVLANAKSIKHSESLGLKANPKKYKCMYCGHTEWYPKVRK